MKELKEQLSKKAFSSVYLFTGEEKFLIDVYLTRFLDKIFEGQDKTMNLDQFNVDTKDLEKITSSLETLPFFADKRVVVVRDLGLFEKKKIFAAELAETLAIVKDTSICFIIETKVDKRSKLYKYINKNGTFHEFNYLKEKELIDYIARELKKHHKKISSRTVSHFLHNVGYDLNSINIELAKLIDYCSEGEVVTEEDIEEVCVKHLESRIFDLVDAIGNKNRKVALNLFYDMLALREPISRILFMISRQINLLFQVKLFALQHYSKQDMAKEVKLPPFVVEKIQRQSNNFEMDRLKKILKKLLDLEFEFKSGRINPETGLELMIIEMSK